MSEINTVILNHNATEDLKSKIEVELLFKKMLDPNNPKLPRLIIWSYILNIVFSSVVLTGNKVLCLVFGIIMLIFNIMFSFAMCFFMYIDYKPSVYEVNEELKKRIKDFEQETKNLLTESNEEC